MILGENHWRCTCFKQRVTRKELQQLLLDGEDKSFINGEILDFKKKYLGGGIYEVWFERTNNS